MTYLVIDTSAFSALQRGSNDIKKHLDKSDEIFVPIIVIAELRSGFAFGKQQKNNEVYLRKFLSSPRVSIVNIDENTTEIFGDLYAQLRSLGRVIGQNDLWIASLCVQHQLPLLTLDKGFTAVEQLELIRI